MQILVGADPEFFLRNPNHGSYVNAHGIGTGTKDDPSAVWDWNAAQGRGKIIGAFQVDGMALEFNIAPAEDADTFVGNIGFVLDQYKKIVSGYEFAFDPVATFDQAYFDEQPEVSKELGCVPDYDAWTGEKNSPPDMTKPMRTASGHIHIGWTDGEEAFSQEHFEDCRAVVRQLDYYLGVNSLLWDPDNTRRSMYGRAGAFRPKTYGVEYRVLSNVWLRSPLLQRWIFHAVKKAMADLDEGKSMYKIYGDSAQRIINLNQTNWSDNYQFDFGLPSPPKI